MKEKSNFIFLGVCALVLAIPLIFFNFKADQISVAENRKLAEPISIRQGVTNFMNSLDDCINDRIGFRDNFVQMYRELTVNVIKGKNDKVILGKDGWLFYNEDLPDYTGTNVNEETLNRYITILKKIDTWCKERDIQFVFAVGPNKSTVYSQHMPQYFRPAEKTLLDSLLERAETAGVTMVCPKNELIANRDTQELYMRLDTHWNALGSRYLLNELTAALQLPPRTIPEVSTSTLSTGDLLDMLSVGSVGSSSIGATTTASHGATIEKIKGKDHVNIQSSNTDSFICYRDSFSIAMMEYYTYYFNGPLFWNFNIDFDFVEQQKPKYLVLECVERYIANAVESNANILNS